MKEWTEERKKREKISVWRFNLFQAMLKNEKKKKKKKKKKNEDETWIMKIEAIVL